MKTKTRILLYDLETTPNIVYTWGTYQQNAIKVKKPWELLSVAYKWLGDKDVKCVSRQGDKSDKALTKKVHQLFNEADIVVAHNAVQFDNKKMMAKFAEHNLVPPSPYKTVDTKLVAQRHFAFAQNGLDALGVHLKLGEKQKHSGFDLWLGCMADRPESWKKMIEYNKQDVVLLEKLYLRLRPYATTHPNVVYRSDSFRCPKCDSQKVQKRGTIKNLAGRFNRYQCQNCGGWSQERKGKKHNIVLKNA
jgi:predicted RNA-binding Zn-ribbon protein involved in translation (DUF1610 family)